MKQRGRRPPSLNVVGPPRLIASAPDDNSPPPAPCHLGQVEKEIWEAVTHEWRGSRASFIALTNVLESHQLAREASEVIAAEGLTVVGRDNQTKPHPLCTVVRDNRAAFMRGLKQLGVKI
jgi:P27 family predicted phage terminase small subunit